MSIDLNRLRETIRQNQTSGNATPSDPGRQVVVDKEGNVRFGDQVSGDQPVTQVPQETFAV